MSFLKRENTQFVLIDMQEKFAPAIHEFEKTAGRISVLIRSLNLLGVPATVTEQYPKGLGPTIPLLKADLENASFFEKGCFSCFGSGEIASHLESLGRKSLILAGVESHVCLLLTALDAKERGYEVFLPYDAVSSRSPEDKARALEYLQVRGVHVVPSETLIFGLLGTSADPVFRAVSKTVK